MEQQEALVGKVSTGLGPADIWRVPSDVLRLASWKVIYAVVLGPSDRYASHPVAMYVTVKVRSLGPRVDGGPVEDFWSPWADLIDTVYADKAMGRKMSGCDASVDVGRWLLDRGFFQQHSPSRTDAGECWARRVGGPLPERAETLDHEIIRRNGAAELERIRARWPWAGARVPAPS